MNNEIFVKKRSLQKVLNVKGILYSLLVVGTLLCLISTGDKSINGLIGKVFGNIRFNNYNDFLSSMPLFYLPQLGIIIIWGNYFDESILANSSIIFTRTRKVKKVMVRYILEMIVGVFIMTLCLEGVLLMVNIMRGYRLHNFDSLVMDLLLYILYMIFLVLVINVISIIMNVMYSVIVALSMQLIFLYTIYMVQNEFLSRKIYYLLPTSSILFFENFQLSIWKKGFWVIYLLTLILMLCVTSCKLIEKKEFMK